MKKIKIVLQFYFIFNCCLMFSCKQDNNIVIKGDIKGLNTKMVYLHNNYPVGSPPIDSAQVLNNKFEFSYHPDTIFQPNLVFLTYLDKKGKIQSLSMVNPYDKRSHYQAFIMEPGITMLTGTITKNSNINIEAGKQNEFYFKNPDLPFIMISRDSAKRQAHAERIKKLIHTNPDAYWIRFAFENLKFQFTKTQLNVLYDEFSDNIKQSYEGKKLKQFIEFLPKNENDFSNNTLIDVKNTSVNLIDPTKKLNMIVFWASWCGPCRMEIPSLKRIVLSVTSKDFRIASVTIDDNKEKWLKAVHEENMSWEQLFIQAEKRQQAVAQYNLYYIPQIYLVNNKNIIVRKFKGFDESNEIHLKTFINQYLSKN